LNNNISSGAAVTISSSGDLGDPVKTIGRLDIGDSALSGGTYNRFTFSAGTNNGVLDFNGNGGAAQLNELATGSGDIFNVPITLSSDLDITNANSISLALNGSITAGSAQNLTVKSGSVTFGGSVGATGAVITLRLGDSAGSTNATILGVGAAYTNNITVQSATAGNTLRLGNSGNTSTVFSGQVTVNRDLNVHAGGSGSVNLNATVSGSALTGSSNLIVSAAAAANTVTLGGSNSGFTGNVSVNSGTFRVSNAAALSVANTVAVDTGATFSLSTNSTTAVHQTIAGLNNGANGGGTVTNASNQARTLTLNGASDYSYGGIITATTAANLALNKTGAGTQVLTGASTYTGATTVAVGRLIVGDGVSGSLGNTAVSVLGGTLGGRGTIGGSVNVASGATLAAGTDAAESIGTLSTGNFTLAGKLAVDVNTTANTADKVAVAGTVNVSGATLELSFAPATFAGAYGATFVLIDNNGLDDAIAGSFAGLARGGLSDSAVVDNGLVQATLYYSYNADSLSLTGGNDLAIQFTSVPEPGALLLSGVPIVLLSRRRSRRCVH
jgi:autotransporter-associated beta strand protein